MKASPVCVHTPFVLNLLEISALWVKASPRGRLHPSIGAARMGWERGKARVKEKRSEAFTCNRLFVSMLPEWGEAVKAKIEKRRTGARNTRARGGTRHPRGGGDPPAERKKRGRTTKKLGGGDGKCATFRSPRRGGNKGGGARRITTCRCKKKWARGGEIVKDFVTLPRKRDTTPSGADFWPHRLDRRPNATRKHPLACHLKTAVRPTSPRL